METGTTEGGGLETGGGMELPDEFSEGTANPGAEDLGIDDDENVE